jgi:hypothetical protein
MASFGSLEASLRDVLPAFARDGFAAANLQFGGFPVPFGAMPGITMQLTNTAGQAQRVLRIEGQTLAFTCNNFTVWSDVWPEVRRVFAAVLALLNPGNFIVASQLAIVDQFDFLPGTPYDVFELYRKDSAYLPAHVANSGKFWHVHHGWWSPDSVDIKGRPAVLNNMNVVNIQEGTIHAPGREYSQIEHVQAARSLNFPIDVLEFEPVITNIFEGLRQANYDLLRALLTDEKLEGMGLK